MACKRRQRAGSGAAHLKRYVRAVVDVNDVGGAVSPAAVGCVIDARPNRRAMSPTTPGRMSDNSLPPTGARTHEHKPAVWADIHSLYLSSIARGFVCQGRANQAWFRRSLPSHPSLEPLTFWSIDASATKQTSVVSVVRRQLVVPATSGPGRSHVNHVKPQQPRGLATSTSHGRLKRSPRRGDRFAPRAATGSTASTRSQTCHSSRPPAAGLTTAAGRRRSSAAAQIRSTRASGLSPLHSSGPGAGGRLPSWHCDRPVRARSASKSDGPGDRLPVIGCRRNQSSRRGRPHCPARPDGSRSRLPSHRSRASTDAAVHRHAGPADGRHSPRSATAASPREAVALSPRARALPQLVRRRASSRVGGPSASAGFGAC